jgi:hypothetical protein
MLLSEVEGDVVTSKSVGNSQVAFDIIYSLIRGRFNLLLE